MLEFQVLFFIIKISDGIAIAQSTNHAQLPLELIAEIFDRLHGDRKALAVCSLVCKSWTRLARYRLFEDVTIHHRAGMLLEVGSTAMVFIRRLSLLPRNALLYNEIILQLGGLEMIRSLSLSNFAWRVLKPEVKSAFFAHFSSIVRLQLRVVGTLAFSDLATIICAFPRLETLVFIRYSALLHDDPSPSAICLPRNLRELELRVTDVNTFLNWLLSIPTIPAFRTVYLHGALPQVTESFLQALGPSLEVLRCDSYGETDNL